MSFSSIQSGILADNLFTLFVIDSISFKLASKFVANVIYSCFQIAALWFMIFSGSWGGDVILWDGSGVVSGLVKVLSESCNDSNYILKKYILINKLIFILIIYYNNYLNVILIFLLFHLVLVMKHMVIFDVQKCCNI